MPRSNIALMAATAVVTALLTTTMPAVARAGYDAMNSDKVDGKHAVSAGATEKLRRGRLVATSPRTGRLPNNIIAKAPDASRLDGLNSTAFLQRDGKARDADKLDGRDLRNVMPKAWTFDLVGDNAPLGETKSVQQFTISLPGPGQLMTSGMVQLVADRPTNTLTVGTVWLNDAASPGNDPNASAQWFISPQDDTRMVFQRIPMVKTFEVRRAGDMTLHVFAQGQGGMRYFGGRVQLHFIPE